MSKAWRETKWLRCSLRWKGQANSPEQRRTIPSPPVAVSSRTTGVFSGHGQTFGKAKGFVPFGRAARSTSSTWGMTSPARWTVTVSPMRMSTGAPLSSTRSGWPSRPKPRM